ncbi:hypothetical protein ANOM_006703 [Aspergillus nomiae NRRL 13137]|uniref:lytic cellulose monooxygenase (C4-dehydrogenating) n=1 Tax=Aspergillus nomiae NRRL (strain ATCC 15546 / NRRL 13137 / CBS 260.88 / M93) TaxID=1509407 RepID=A0A0L1J054_ASPN3|nr:uncharacterized protein ANOM_006703 [Aspergillus nomiae NRRL 13137]KNG84793.1 hypothetical protein ANOM_006703 [Aspergillus nomiae NRRL 13137]
MKFQLALALAAAPIASAHYFFPNFIANGNFTKYFEYVREDTQGYMPYKGGYDSTDFRCNVGSQDFASKTDVYKVKAGDTIGFGTDFGALIEHPGPMQVYLSKAPGDVRDFDGSGDWFKIYELGPTSFGSDGIEWGVTGRSNFTFTLPKETPAGQYLVRIEHIALHGAGEWGGAELYFNCAQIEVESDSTAIPYPVVQIPGVYDGYEPGILFYMYRPYWTNYTMPGPRVWPDGGSNVVKAAGVSVAPSGSWSASAVTATVSDSAAIHPVSSSSVFSSTTPGVAVAETTTSSTPVRSLAASTSLTSPTSCNLEPVYVTVTETTTVTTQANSMPTSNACGPQTTVTATVTTTTTITPKASAV